MHIRALGFALLAVATLHTGCFGGDKKGNGPSDVNAPDAGGAGSGAGAGAAGTNGGTTGAGSGGMGAGTGAAGTAATAGTTAPPPGQDGAALAALSPMLADAYCGVITRCVPPAIASLVFGSIDCTTQVLTSIEDGELTDLSNAVDAGRVIYNPAMVDACFQMLDALGCDSMTASLLSQGVCGDIVTGTVPEGGDCGLDAECIGDTFCDRTAGCPGKCVPQLGEGQTCRDDDQCLDPLSCDSETQKCAMSGGPDDTCGGGVAPDCGLGLMCVGDDADTMKTGTCKPTDQIFVGAKDAVCDFDTGRLCVDGLSCVVTITGMGVNAMATFACTDPVGAGAPCGFAIPPQCPAEQYCAGLDLMAGDAEGTCTPLPGDGAACVQQYGASCGADLLCDIDGLCHPLARIGDPCVSGLGCASGRCVSGMCQRPPKCEVR